ncbi:trypsin Inhibitor like cysteine rich domain protein [Oesophagostomum dentatum]|uniref:Trypsin Inhibitor like cysteine rich domain protein n=1 Tax=Oesophagostomum dentatum TaxID=61180 RepID=A0A0B1T0C0_OESDE|nr:trypsin Inhibitor like cysteine rich domain protein [Oesophagostomum dentatum]
MKAAAVLAFAEVIALASAGYPFFPSLKCGKNEVYNRCGNACEKTCYNAMPTCILMCGPPACVCQSGFYRNDKGECTDNCSKGYQFFPSRKCGKNEVYNRCGYACEPSCYNAAPICPRLCGPPACNCQSGFYRNDKGECTNDCSKEPCPENMERKSCAKPYYNQKDCHSINYVEETHSSKYCIPNGCECKSGYVIDSRSYVPKCVPEKSCEKAATNFKKSSKA